MKLPDILYRIHKLSQRIDALLDGPLGHLLLTIITGGLWLIVVFIAYLILIYKD